MWFGFFRGTSSCFNCNLIREWNGKMECFMLVCGKTSRAFLGIKLRDRSLRGILEYGGFQQKIKWISKEILPYTVLQKIAVFPSSSSFLLFSTFFFSFHFINKYFYIFLEIDIQFRFKCCRGWFKKIVERKKFHSI